MEADKQNAAKLNALVQITSPAEDWPIGGRPPHSDGISRGRRSEQDRSQQSNSNRSTAKCHTFGEVRKKQPGCVRHRAVVGFMYKRYPAWLILIHLHGRWFSSLFTEIIGSVGKPFDSLSCMEGVIIIYSFQHRIPFLLADVFFHKYCICVVIPNWEPLMWLINYQLFKDAVPWNYAVSVICFSSGMAPRQMLHTSF